jgi:aryl-alcohol dehydrogenase-like predicted oxidoreductase
MIELESLSMVGFGSHLVSARFPEHRDALNCALACGCNLVDTSASYMRGESESLIGEVLSDRHNSDAFVVTKSGYDEREDSSILGAGQIGRNLLNPDFLAERIQLSLSRLRRPSIDGYLLHSPEAFLHDDDPLSEAPELFYASVRRAFEFLEDMVAGGRVRFYGVSSNTFPLSLEEGETIDLHRLIAIANAVASPNHFRIIEFPFNFMERGAQIPHHGGVSLIALAQANGIITLSNRPLTASSQQGVLRIGLPIDYEDSVRYVGDPALWAECLGQIESQLVRRGSTDRAMSFGIVRHLASNWTRIGNPSAASQLFQEFLQPFLSRLYSGDIPKGARELFSKLYESALRYARRTMIERTLAFREELLVSGVIAPDDDRPLPLIACEHYLDCGIDHVLVGMRQTDYVDQLRQLFAPRPWAES